MEDQKITYKHWQTGKELTYTLSFSHPSEHKTDLICSLDNTSLIYSYDDLGKSHFCPNCSTNYNHKYNTQESVNEYFQEHINQLKRELVLLDNKRNDLVSFLEKAEGSLQNNQANLSANSLENTSRKVRTDDFSYDDAP